MASKQGASVAIKKSGPMITEVWTEDELGRFNQSLEMRRGHWILKLLTASSVWSNWGAFEEPGLRVEWSPVRVSIL